MVFAKGHEWSREVSKGLGIHFEKGNFFGLFAGERCQFWGVCMPPWEKHVEPTLVVVSGPGPPVWVVKKSEK